MDGSNVSSIFVEEEPLPAPPVEPPVDATFVDGEETAEDSSDF